jgi:hypothetical protein
MKIEVLVNLKGTDGTIWGKGTVFDGEKQSIPQDLLSELKLKTGNVRAIGEVDEPPKKSPETPKETGTLKVEEPIEKSEKEPTQSEGSEVPDFKNKTEIRQAKAKDLSEYLKSKGVSTSNLNREGLIEKALEVLEI